MSIHVRWMIRRDLADVLRIENSVFPFPWSEDEFIRCLRQRNCIGIVADTEPPESKASRVVGYCMYELHKNRLHILDFAVDPDYWRQGVGRAMADKLKAKLSYQNRRRITLEVRETNLDAQLFFKSQGFLATSLLRDFYEQTTEDAIAFNFRIQVPMPVAEAAL